jgi:hypothetical protein
LRYTNGDKEPQDMIAELLTIIKSMNEKKEETLISINESENME